MTNESGQGHLSDGMREVLISLGMHYALRGSGAGKDGDQDVVGFLKATFSPDDNFDFEELLKKAFVPTPVLSTRQTELERLEKEQTFDEDRLKTKNELLAERKAELTESEQEGGDKKVIGQEKREVKNLEKLLDKEEDRLAKAKFNLQQDQEQLENDQKDFDKKTKDAAKSITFIKSVREYFTENGFIEIRFGLKDKYAHGCFHRYFLTFDETNAHKKLQRWAAMPHSDKSREALMQECIGENLMPGLGMKLSEEDLEDIRQKKLDLDAKIERLHNNPPLSKKALFILGASFFVLLIISQIQSAYGNGALLFVIIVLSLAAGIFLAVKKSESTSTETK